MVCVSAFVTFYIVLILYPEDKSAIKVRICYLVWRRDFNLPRPSTQRRVGGSDVLDIAVTCTACALRDREPRRKRFRRPPCVRRGIDRYVSVCATRRCRCIRGIDCERCRRRAVLLDGQCRRADLCDVVLARRAELAAERTVFVERADKVVGICAPCRGDLSNGVGDRDVSAYCVITASDSSGVISALSGNGAAVDGNVAAA